MNRAGRVVLTGVVAALAGCSDASLGVLGTGSSSRLDVDVVGPSSTLGAYRFYDGVRLLECDVTVEARADGGSTGATAEWLDGVIDIYDLRTGEYVASDYLYPGEMDYLWGAREIASGERQLSRPLRYTSYGPFRVYFSFWYDAGGEPRETTHRFDCR